MSKNNSLNNEKSRLIQEAAKKTGISVDKLQKAADSGDVNSVMASLDPATAQKLNQVLSDKDKMNKLLESEQIQKLMKKLSGN